MLNSNPDPGDHTFDLAKNFNDPEVKMAFDIVTGVLRLALLVLTKTTSIEEVLHAIEDLVHRNQFGVLFDPRTLYTDTWPANRDVWATHLLDCLGRLGLFHWMKRILDSLRPGHKDIPEVTCGKPQRDSDRFSLSRLERH